jgi:hypothetical protein
LIVVGLDGGLQPRAQKFPTRQKTAFNLAIGISKLGL